MSETRTTIADVHDMDEKSRRVALTHAIRLGEHAKAHLQELDRLRDELLALAQDAHDDARAAWDHYRSELSVFDREGESRLAQTGGRVRSLRARVATAKNATPPGNVAELEDELAVAMAEDEAAVKDRLNQRSELAAQARAAREAVLSAGVKRLGLSLSWEQQLRQVVEAGERAEEMRMVESRAEGQFRRTHDGIERLIGKLERVTTDRVTTVTPSLYFPAPVYTNAAAAHAQVDRFSTNGADLHQDGGATR